MYQLLHRYSVNVDERRYLELSACLQHILNELMTRRHNWHLSPAFKIGVAFGRRRCLRPRRRRSDGFIGGSNSGFRGGEGSAGLRRRLPRASPPPHFSSFSPAPPHFLLLPKEPVPAGPLLLVLFCFVSIEVLAKRLCFCHCPLFVSPPSCLHYFC